MNYDTPKYSNLIFASCANYSENKKFPVAAARKKINGLGSLVSVRVPLVVQI